MNHDGIVEQATKALAEEWDNMPANESLGRPRMLADALADAGLLARPLPTRDEIADELSGWPIGTGYYQTRVANDEARDMADAVLALLKGQEV